MRRREFIAGLGGTVAWPLVTQAQQPVPMVGLLAFGKPEENTFRVDAVREGLREMGFAEGRNLVMQYRWADSYDRLPELAAGLVDARVAVIISNSTNAALAAKQATASIPVVFVVGGDPVAFGLVASLNRPGGNVTGISFLGDTLVAKHVEILHEILPGAGSLGLIVNPSNANADPDVRQAQAAAKKVGLGLVVLKASTSSDLEAAFAKCAREKVAGLLVLADPAFNNQRELLLGLAARYALPAIYAIREFPDEGGLMSYGASITGAFREMGRYAGRILRGVKPSDLPVQQATRLELVVNLKTAKALGLTIPLSLLGRADEVIE
jgi:putative tryptophan/tyrosine transport system substrate-binding protein